MTGETLSYAGKRVVVTGCYSGIGQATARLLLDLGARVHGLDLRPNDLPLDGFTPLDLRDVASIEAAAEAVEGRVDALFNCAGIPPGPPPLDVMKVNFIGTRHLTELLVPRMGSGGAIANVASNGGAGWSRNVPRLLDLIGTDSFDTAAAWFGANGDDVPAAYSFSKEAIIVWTLSLSSTLIKQGIRVNCTSPGAVQTPMLDEIERVTPSELIDVMAQPIGRRSDAAEQAVPLVFLNSDAASYGNGVVLPVDGGFLAAQAIAQRGAPASPGRR
ncbi:coniferyl-alcohol dehydrogenase [Sphingomonas solaris]|uniref:SDR family oxidoreductase n=1 Tax=Alterirhizorhabdus solaris TaxID=2529389 RepID=A0A558RBA0_9SPHN|nr:coniferyl-alcohol dehydrogenase [Sphingomonas solaris]TVV76618.1 SDR family oxidoreductase [Sphingomonas solaris]